jgi:hypothetical protein
MIKLCPPFHRFVFLEASALLCGTPLVPDMKD